MFFLSTLRSRPINVRINESQNALSFSHIPNHTDLSGTASVEKVGFIEYASQEEMEESSHPLTLAKTT